MQNPENVKQNIEYFGEFTISSPGRDQISFSTAISASKEINPMTMTINK